MGRTERITWMNRRLENGDVLSVKLVTDRFEVTEKTVKRDIEYLRDRCDAPIAWNAALHTYEYSTVWHGLDFLDEHSLLAASFLKVIVNQFNYVPVIADSLEDEFIGQLPESYRDIVDSIVYELPQFEKIPNALVFEICRSIRKRLALHITYLNSNDERSERDIEPRKLVNYSGKWYVIAFDHHRNSLRTFSLARFESFLPTNNSFFEENISGATKESVERFCSTTYGIYKGSVVGSATLRFYGAAASNVRNSVWHPAQSMHVLQDPVHGNTIELSLPVHDYPELLGRALRCGASCEVVSPPEFRQRWKEEIRKMALLADDH